MKRILILLLLLPAFGCRCYAEELTEQAAIYSGAAELPDRVPEDVREITGDWEAGYSGEGALNRLWNRMLGQLEGELQKNLGDLLVLLLMALLCAVCCTLCSDATVQAYINISGVCAVAARYLGGVDGLISQTMKALYLVDDYSAAALPVMFTAAAAGGAPASSAARYAAICLGLDVIMKCAQKLVIPFIYAFLALSLSRGLFDQPILRSLQHAVKWMATIIMTGVTLVFSGYIGITGAVSGTVDVLAVKTARTVLSTVLPVVGGLIADTSAAVLAAANLIKASAGAFSLIAVCAICAGPFIVLSVKILLFKMAAAVCEMVPDNRLTGFISDLATAMNLLLGLLGTVSIILFISFMSAIRVVGG